MQVGALRLTDKHLPRHLLAPSTNRILRPRFGRIATTRRRLAFTACLARNLIVPGRDRVRERGAGAAKHLTPRLIRAVGAGVSLDRGQLSRFDARFLSVPGVIFRVLSLELTRFRRMAVGP